MRLHIQMKSHVIDEVGPSTRHLRKHRFARMYYCCVIFLVKIYFYYYYFCNIILANYHVDFNVVLHVMHFHIYFRLTCEHREQVV
jgi:hypothetical protein